MSVFKTELVHVLALKFIILGDSLRTSLYHNFSLDLMHMLYPIHLPHGNITIILT